MIQTAIRYLGNTTINLLPSSRLFAVKRSILRLMGVKVASGASVNKDIAIYGGGHIVIGENSWIGPGCVFYASQGTTIAIGDNCDIAPEVAFVTGSHEIGGPERRAGQGFSSSIEVGSGCWIGFRSTIMGGSKIGRGIVIGANSLVKSDLDPDSIYAGVPARLIRTLKK